MTVKATKAIVPSGCECWGTVGLTIDYQDESFSTVEAENVLLAADLSRARRKEVVDRLAAAVILQAWLDAQRPKTISEEPI